MKSAGRKVVLPQLKFDNRGFIFKVVAKPERRPFMPRRSRYTAEQKVRILREHLENQVPVSELCQRFGIHPNLFYKWKKDLG